MRVYRCRTCTCGFAVFLKRGRENKGGKGITCPLCAGSEVEEIDVVREMGARVAERLVDLWKRLPDGD